jgi:hypothetical protein
MSETDRKLIQADLPPAVSAPNTTPAPKGRHNRWVYALIVIGVIIAALWALKRSDFPGARTTETISQPITAASAEITLGNTVGRLEVSANSTGKLIDGTLELGGNDRLERELATRDGVQIVRLEAVTGGVNIGVSDLVNRNDLGWKIGLAPKLPIKLRVKVGVGVGNLELTELSVTDLTVNSGVGQMTVVLPASGKVTARIEGGIGELNVIIPRGMLAQIRASNGLGEVSVSGDFERSGDVYTSSGFASASDRVLLTVKGGVGGVTVKQSTR